MRHTINCRLSIHEVQERVSDNGGEYAVFEGIAAPFNEVTPSYNELIKPGAFKRTINATKGGRVPILFMHGGMFGLSQQDWIGMNEYAEERREGLFQRAMLTTQTSDSAKAVHGLMKLSAELKRPAGESIGFMPVKVLAADNKPTEILEARLFEFSITPPDFQAYAGAKVGEIRSNALMDAVVECLIDLGIRSPELEQYQATREAELDSLSGRPGHVNDSPGYDPALLDSIRDQLNIVTTKLRS